MTRLILVWANMILIPYCQLLLNSSFCNYYDVVWTWHRLKLKKRAFGILSHVSVCCAVSLICRMERWEMKRKLCLQVMRKETHSRKQIQVRQVWQTLKLRANKPQNHLSLCACVVCCIMMNLLGNPTIIYWPAFPRLLIEYDNVVDLYKKISMFQNGFPCDSGSFLLVSFSLKAATFKTDNKKWDIILWSNYM